MHQRISKKIVVYLFLFLTLVTLNNINLLNFNFLKIITLNFTGLNDIEKKKFEEDLDFLKKENLIFLDKDKISKKIFKNKIVEDFSVFKNYPSELEILDINTREKIILFTSSLLVSACKSGASTNIASPACNEKSPAIVIVFIAANN